MTPQRDMHVSYLIFIEMIQKNSSWPNVFPFSIEKWQWMFLLWRTSSGWSIFCQRCGWKWYMQYDMPWIRFVQVWRRELLFHLYSKYVIIFIVKILANTLILYKITHTFQLVQKIKSDLGIIAMKNWITKNKPLKKMPINVRTN